MYAIWDVWNLSLSLSIAIMWLPSDAFERRGLTVTPWLRFRFHYKSVKHVFYIQVYCLYSGCGNKWRRNNHMVTNVSIMPSCYSESFVGGQTEDQVTSLFVVEGDYQGVICKANSVLIWIPTRTTSDWLRNSNQHISDCGDVCPSSFCWGACLLQTKFFVGPIRERHISSWCKPLVL